MMERETFFSGQPVIDGEVLDTRLENYKLMSNIGLTRE